MNCDITLRALARPECILAGLNRSPVLQMRQSVPPRAKSGHRCMGAIDPSFDHLVGGCQQGCRHRQPERLGGFKVDRHLKFGRLNDRQVCGRLAF